MLTRKNRETKSGQAREPMTPEEGKRFPQWARGRWDCGPSSGESKSNESMSDSARGDPGLIGRVAATTELFYGPFVHAIRRKSMHPYQRGLLGSLASPLRPCGRKDR